ncbi:MAG TPA: sortase [Propionibacteriaceae bacterium]|nr:sortase [Propionibacteriaceae bacterium]
MRRRSVLAKGVGHLYGTSLPVEGTGSHAVLTSRTGLAHATFFDHLDKLVIGDLIFVDVDGETIAYEVDQI